jgi:5-(carboxyamino)imidazole ribonucleotide mutase
MNPRVAIIMGSRSDAEVMQTAEEFLAYFGIDFETHIMSAHRMPEDVARFAANAEKEGFAAIIAGAGMAAHLPGVIASYTPLPVIGVPLSGSALNGVDALYAIVQMPQGVPVATMAIGKAGAGNAAIFVAEMLAARYETVKQKLLAFRKNKCQLPK